MLVLSAHAAMAVSSHLPPIALRYRWSQIRQDSRINGPGCQAGGERA